MLLKIALALELHIPRDFLMFNELVVPSLSVVSNADRFGKACCGLGESVDSVYGPNADFFASSVSPDFV
jgi:hypothetical protein